MLSPFGRSQHSQSPWALPSLKVLDVPWSEVGPEHHRLLFFLKNFLAKFDKEPDETDRAVRDTFTRDYSYTINDYPAGVSPMYREQVRTMREHIRAHRRVVKKAWVISTNDATESHIIMWSTTKDFVKPTPGFSNGVEGEEEGKKHCIMAMQVVETLEQYPLRRHMQVRKIKIYSDPDPEDVKIMALASPGADWYESHLWSIPGVHFWRKGWLSFLLCLFVTAKNPIVDFRQAHLFDPHPESGIWTR